MKIIFSCFVLLFSSSAFSWSPSTPGVRLVSGWASTAPAPVSTKTLSSWCAGFPVPADKASICFQYNANGGASYLPGWAVNYCTGTNSKLLYSIEKLPGTDHTYYCIPFSIANLPKNMGPKNCAGNPINIGVGNKYQHERDFSLSSGLILDRFYNSQLGTITSQPNSSWGKNWLSYYDRSISDSDGSKVVFRQDGKSLRFTLSGGSSAWVPDSDVSSKLEKLAAGWRYTNNEIDEIELYDNAGRLQSITSRPGYTQTLIYSDATTPSSVAPAPNLLIQVIDSYNRSLSFSYDSSSRVASMTVSGGGVYYYNYDSSTNNLISVTYPDTKIRTYAYNESIHTSGANLPNALTGIIDEKGNRFATFKYDVQGRAISSEHNLPSNQTAEKVSIAYSTDASGNVISSVVTDALNTVRTYSFSTILGVVKNTAVTQPCASGCGTNSATSYDTNGNVSSKTDFNGNKICYAYDLTRNLETQRVEGLASTTICSNALSSLPINARQIKTQWHPNSRLEVKRAESKRLTTLVYNGQPDPSGVIASCAPATALVNGLPIAVLCKKIEEATTDTTGAAGFSATTTGTPRTWTYTYNALGQVLTANGPRTDVNDVTTYTYYPSASTTAGSVHSIGDLATVTNALNHVTSITNYDLNGRPLSITDPNGVVTTLTYWPRGWLKTKAVNGVQTTKYDYDGVGQLTQITLPDNSALKYTYDTAHRLTDIENGSVAGGVLTLSGNKIHYTLDAMGNRTQEDTRDVSVIRKTQSREFNSLNQLWKDIGGTSPSTQITQYTYDNNGNLKTITDPNNIVTQNAYDAFNRLWTVTTDLNNSSLTSNGVTTYGYDGLDQTTQVKDARLVTTDYTIDGLGNVTLTQSPDSGNTNNIHDAAGNVTQTTDARGVVSNYTYDALNRLKTITYPSDASANLTFAYDIPNPYFPYSKGRLSYIQAQNGDLVGFAYDVYGNRLWIDDYSEAADDFYSSFQYDSANRVKQVFYSATGRQTIYTRNSLGQITQVQTQDNSSAPLQTIVSNVSYEPFGPIKNVTFGNSATTAIQHDADYRISRITTTSLPGWDYVYGYDAAGNLTSTTDQIGTTSKTFGYDNLSRVTSDSIYNYGYDKGSNRLSGGFSWWPYTQTYATTSNRLTQLNTTLMPSDAAGNLQQESGGGTLVYNAANQLTQWSKNGATVNYRYNGFGWRNAKQSTVLTHYDYLPDGKLVGQVKFNTNGSYNEIIEYLWLDDLPIAQIKTTYAANNVVSARRLTYIHADHINTPRLMTDSTKKVVWTWNVDAYGLSAPSTNPDGDSVIDTLDLRFPGQLADSESGLYYNMYRYYDPMTGRYTQSDPIGLDGGLNTFGYVGGNPVSYIDPTGQNAVVVGVGVVAIGALAIAANSGNPAVQKAIGNVAEAISNGGNAVSPAPYSHDEEAWALGLSPDPFGGNCPQIEKAIKILRAQIKWRKTDLNPFSPTYLTHKLRISILNKALERLESAYRNICGKECPSN